MGVGADPKINAATLTKITWENITNSNRRLGIKVTNIY